MYKMYRLMTCDIMSSSIFPIPTTFLSRPGRVYSSCVQNAMLCASETWPLTKPSLQCLQRNDRAMIRQICNVEPQDTSTIRSTERLARLGIEDLDLILKERRLPWYGHMERSKGAVKTAFDIQVDRKLGPEDPDLILKERRLRWYGHVERSKGAVKTAFDIQGPVVQSIINLTSSLRGQLVKCCTTL